MNLSYNGKECNNWLFVSSWIGVQYRPNTEFQSHYGEMTLGLAYDLVIFQVVVALILKCGSGWSFRIRYRLESSSRLQEKTNKWGYRIDTYLEIGESSPVGAVNISAGQIFNIWYMRVQWPTVDWWRNIWLYVKLLSRIFLPFQWKAIY